MNSLISVIMPVYNGSRYLAVAIESILNQTYENFELIIINDGSKDNSLEIIHKYAKLDQRIRVVSRENRGLVRSLNEGLLLAQGKYIARMDQDDISLISRFEQQVEFLSMNNIDLCGTWMDVFENERVIYTEKYPVSDVKIKAEMIFKNPIGHPTVMFKKSKINFYYDYPDAEDFATWLLESRNLIFANIPKVLVKYRKHSNNTCIRNNRQRESLFKIFNKYSFEYNINLDIPLEHIDMYLSENRGFSSSQMRILEVFYFQLLYKIDKKYFNVYKKNIIKEMFKLYIKNISNVRLSNLKYLYKMLRRSI